MTVEHAPNDGGPDSISLPISHGSATTEISTRRSRRSGHPLRHVSAIPFENLDIVLGRAISLDLADLQANLVTSRRGGYCSSRTRFSRPLSNRSDFKLIRLAAQVRFGTTAIRPRTHMLLAVEVEKARWLADVGFGGAGLSIRSSCKGANPPAGCLVVEFAIEGDELVLESLESRRMVRSFMRLPEIRNTRLTTRLAIITRRPTRTRPSCETWWCKRVARSRP